MSMMNLNAATVALPEALPEALPFPLPIEPEGPLAHNLASARSADWRDFLEATKPRMNVLVVATMMVGLYMASPGPTPWRLLAWASLGTALLAGCASVCNQIWERRCDALMRRTRNRPLAAGRLSVRQAAIFAATMGIAGGAALLAKVNALTALLGLSTVVCYVLVYTPMKRRSTLNTAVGAIAGALPPLMGWTAVTNSLDAGGLALATILFTWQMPHFLAIAVLYRDDYALAGFKMLPVVDDERLSATGRQMVLYAMALVPASLLPSMLRLTGGPLYVIAAAVLGAGFIVLTMACALSPGRREARRVFLASIIYLPALMTCLMIDAR